MQQDLDQQQVREIINFQLSYNRRKMKATWALAVCMVGMYLLEEYFGGSQNVATLIRMGANVGARVKEGEYFRLMSSVFLHAGFMHIFFNTYVLFALGGFFNRILGESKYLVIFFVSGIMGSITSVFLGKAALSVGASGAIWGLFGASLALSVFKTSLIPDAIRLRLRRVTLINLVINLGVSLLPMIDMWAHIGGGVGGFLMSLPLIIRPRTRLTYRILRYIFGLLAWMLALIYAASIMYGFYRFEPWVDPFHTELAPHQFAEVPFTLFVPKDLALQKGPANTHQTASYSFGDPKLDSLLVEVHFFHENNIGQKADLEWLKAQSQQLLSAPNVSPQTKKTVYLRNADGGVLYYQQFMQNNSVILHNYVFVRNHYVIKLGILVAANIPQAQVDELGKRMMAGLQDKLPLQ